MRKIKYKILLTFIISTSIFVILTGGYSIFNLIQLNRTETSNMQKMLYDDYDRMIKSEVETAAYVLNSYYESYKDGQITEDQAKEEAKRVIKDLRYDQEGYFWIDDTNGVLIAHPMLPEQEGTNRMDIKDPNGVQLIKEVIAAAKDNKNSGYTDFMWEKPQDVGSGKLSPKRAYSQLFKPWNWVVSTGNYVDSINTMIESKRLELDNGLVRNIIASAIFVVVSLIAICIVSLILSRKISNPIIKLVKAFEKDENGRLSMQKIDIDSRDEIGLLASTLNQMSLQVREFIDGVVAVSKDAVQSAGTVDSDMSLLYEQIQQISSTTEEISAGMEEAAASSEEMSAASAEIAESVESIAGKAREAAASVKDISERAGTLKSNLVSAVESGNSILNQVKENLDNAIEQSKSVTQINELADAILQITGQTNLLALNAAIEASRAGEAGRGFAVVADEIRKLAEDSKITAGRIQSIIKTVITSVDNLSGNSSQLLDFMSTNVKGDYDLMLKASDEYNNDATHLKSIVSDFLSTAEALNASIRNMTKAIEEITSTTNEGAQGTNSITERIMLVTEKSNELLLQADKSNKYSESLLSLVSKFKI